MHSVGPTNSSPTCVTIDEVYGERPGPCCDDAVPTKESGSKETGSSLDYFEDVLIHIIATPM